MTDAVDALAAELERRMSAGPEGWGPDRFNELALRAFEAQFHGNPPYGALCRRRGVRPGSIGQWQDVPLVPATAFKHLELITGPRPPDCRVFETSGTTQGPRRRGRHFVPRLGLYRASAVGHFGRHLLPEGQRLPLVSLIPSPEEAPASSLSCMMGLVAEALCDGVRWAVDAAGTVDLQALEEAARGGPVLLAGTALALLHVVEDFGGTGRLRLPAGSRVMETGGFKGLARSVTRGELYEGIAEVFGVDPGRIVNEYGMTELLSQLYEPVLTEGEAARGVHRPPPWLGVRAVDPVTLEERGPGEEGLLAFFDLANLGSVCGVLTEDVGAVGSEGVRLRGRVAGAEPRGCSRAMDELMSAAGRKVP